LTQARPPHPKITLKTVRARSGHPSSAQDAPRGDHEFHREWVYNGAEIDSAKVLWARELDSEQNAKLLAYFRNRHVWLVGPDKDNTELIPY